MIIETVLNGFYTVFSALISAIDIPNLPNKVYEYIETLFDYMIIGGGILANYTPLSYLLILFFIVLAVDVGLNIYYFVMWVIRKIPFTGIT